MPKYCWYLHHITFFIFIDPSQVNWVGKGPSYWHEKSWVSILTHWLPMKSILFLIETIQRYQFKCNYLRNKKLFLNFLLHFWNLSEILNVLKKKITLIAFVFPILRTLKTWLDKCLKSPLSEEPSTSNMGNSSKHCPNLDHSTFILFMDHRQVNWVGKSLSYWHQKSGDCLLTHRLPMKCILFLIETI